MEHRRQYSNNLINGRRVKLLTRAAVCRPLEINRRLLYTFEYSFNVHLKQYIIITRSLSNGNIVHGENIYFSCGRSSHVRFQGPTVRDLIDRPIRARIDE